MPEAIFRIYAELNDFLPAYLQQKKFVLNFDEKTSIKHIIESLGIPHTEVDLILINGVSVDFQARPAEGDFISVYPVFEGLDIGGVARLRPKPLREPRFILDAHLGKLAVYLRMLGFDTLYENDYEDEALANLASRQKRILLTRDRGLLKRTIVTHGCLIRNEKPVEQLLEVLKRYDLFGNMAAFTRCLVCNELLVPVKKDEIYRRLPSRTAIEFSEFMFCPGCERLFWKGSHYQRMKKVLDLVLEEGAKHEAATFAANPETTS